MLWLAIGIMVLASVAVGVCATTAVWMNKTLDRQGQAYYDGFRDGAKTAQQLAQEAMFGSLHGLTRPRVPKDPYKVN